MSRNDLTMNNFCYTTFESTKLHASRQFKLHEVRWPRASDLQVLHGHMTNSVSDANLRVLSICLISLHPLRFLTPNFEEISMRCMDMQRHVRFARKRCKAWGMCLTRTPFILRHIGQRMLNNSETSASFRLILGGRHSSGPCTSMAVLRSSELPLKPEIFETLCPMICFTMTQAPIKGFDWFFLFFPL